MWRVEFGRKAEKQLDKLDPVVRDRVLRKLAAVAASDDPRATADPLVGDWTGYWRYRVGDHRVIVQFADEVMTVYVIEVAHRREVYR